MATTRQSHQATLPWLSLSLAGLMVALYAAFGPAPEAWVYDRLAISNGEWWRLATGHWVHSDSHHLGWNLGAFMLLGGIIETRHRHMLLPGLVAGTLAVDAMLWIGLPWLTQYCGLSGVLNTLLLLVLFTQWQRTTASTLATIGSLSFAKIVWELLAGQSLLTDIAWTSVPQTHLAGWLMGAALIILASSAPATNRPHT